MALQLLSQFKKQNGNIYKYYSIAEPYYESGKNKKRIITRLGKIDANQAEKIKAALKLSNDPAKSIYSLKDISLLRTYYYMDIALIYNLIRVNGMDRILPQTKSIVDINKVFSLLLIHRIIKPGSKLSAARWIKRTILPTLLKLDNLEMEPQYIYRSLAEIEKSKERIENYLYTLLDKEGRGFENIFYDLTTSYFEGDNVDMAAFNLESKDKRIDKLQLVLGLLIDKHGFPFSWDIYKGNQGESPTMIDQVNKLKKRFNLKSTLLVFDRGFLSHNNLERIKEAGYDYLTGLDSPQTETLIDLNVLDFLMTLDEDNVDKKMELQSEWEKYDDNKYYLKEAYNKRYNGHQTVISFDIDRFKRSRHARGNKIDRFKNWVNKHNKWLSEFKKDAVKNAIIKDVETELKRVGIKKYISYELYEYVNKNKAWKQKSNTPFPSQGYYRKVKTYKIVFRFNSFEKLDGIFTLITSPESNLTVTDMIYYYREKNKIESAFRTMKSLLKLRPWYVYKKEHVHAHYTICVCAYFIEKLLDQKLEILDLKNDGYSVYSLLEELKALMIGELMLGNQKKLDMVKPNEKIKSILLKLNMKKYLNPANIMTNI